VRLCFVVESGTDVRLVEGLAAQTTLEVLARAIPGAATISQPPAPDVPVLVAPPSRLRFAARVVRTLLRATPPYDHVLVQGYGLAALAANLSGRLTATPTTMLVCSPVEGYYRCRRAHPEPGKPFRSAALAALLLLARANARLGMQYVVLSRYLADVVRRHGTRRPVHVIPVYGVDLQRFRPLAGGAPEARARLGIAPGDPLIFFSSRVSPEKDAETMLDAVALLNERGRPVRLLHRSGGHEAFAARARARGIGDHVIATEAVHPARDLPLSYQASDLCVQASRDEGLGFSPLEALACGVPVVATAVGGLRQTIVDGETGWSVPAGDAPALAAAVADALDRPEEARRRAAAGRAMVEREFEASRAFSRLLAALRPAVRS
jgi:glycosyltransferase involved in cell wall biosynthesis